MDDKNYSDETNLNEEKTISVTYEEPEYSKNVYTVYPPEKKKNRTLPIILWLVFTLLLCTGSSFFTAKYVMSKMQKESQDTTYPRHNTVNDQRNQPVCSMYCCQ